MNDHPAVAVLESLEQALARRTLAPEDIDRHLHQDCVEVGKSGRIWTRAEVIASLSAGPQREVDLVELELHPLAEGVILVTYRSFPGSGEPAVRASIWVFAEGRWQMRFHQGTALGGGPGTV